MLRTARFLRQHLRPSAAAIQTAELTYARGAESLPATGLRPSGRSERLPVWVLLHGLTYTGREHPALVGFGRALAASGTAVFVPDVPEWRALRFAPAISEATITAAVLAASRLDGIDPDRIGLIGFSFGATQALIASVDPALRNRLAGVAAWGGYYDVRRLFGFGITGRHDLDGRAYRTRPDPYGAWMAGANYLTSVPGHAEDGDVAEQLRLLAEEAGRRRVYAADPSYDAHKAELSAALPAEKRALFDLFARPSTSSLDPWNDGVWSRDEVEGLALALAEAALARDPLLDPAPFLPQVDVPIVLAHALDDRLVPFTESIRLRRGLPPASVRTCQILALFSHSGGPHEALGKLGRMRETLRFALLLRQILRLL
ncbi:MAG: alpha/beta hydrolase family protein [Longimicrobiales bacterium]